MTVALVVVALTSLALTAVLLVVVWRLMREERRRSAARVAALEAGIRGSASENLESPAFPNGEPLPARPLATAASIIGQLPAPANDEPAARALDSDRPDAWERDMVRTQSDLFGTTAHPAAASRNFGFIAAVGLLIVGTTIGFTAWSSGNRSTHPVADAGSHSTQTVSTATAALPLELVSLRHRRDGDALSITGIVRNPVHGGRVQNLTAVVFLFDRDGGFLASGRAPIDYTTLVPGDESPFVVTVKEPGSVGRYRVSFRTDDTVVPHIDRREDIAVARSVS